MNLLNDWIPDQLLQALGWTLVHSIWQWILVAGLLWGALRIFSKKSPQFKYKLSMASLGIGLLVALSTLFYEWSMLTKPGVQSNIVWAAFESQNAVNQEVGLLETWVIWIESQLPFLVNVWFLGAVLFLFRLFNNLSAVRGLRLSSKPSSDSRLDGYLEELSRRLNISRNVSLKISSEGLSPMAFGIFKPMILIPAGLIFQLSPKQIEAILAHELAHIKRNDYLLNLIQSVLEVVFFFHPCFWWINQTAKELRENATDDLAISTGIEPQTLAKALAEVLNYSQQHVPDLALAASKRRNPTLHRIKRMLGFPAQNYPQNPIISLPMLFTLLLTAGILANASQHDSPEKREVLPLVSIENPELDFIAQNQLVEPIMISVKDTTDQEKKVIVIPEKGEQSWTNENGDTYVFRQKNGNQKFQYEIKGDTLIVDGDTIVKGGKSVFIIQGMPEPEFDFESMPKLELDEMIAMPAMPPMPEFPGEFSFEFFGDMKPFVFESGEPMIFDFDGEMFFFPDTAEMTKEELKNWEKDRERKMKEYEEKQKEYEERVKDWSKMVEERAKEFEKQWKENEKEREEQLKMWEKQIAPKLEAWEKEMQAWQQQWKETQAPKMEEFQQKLKEWEKSQAPKIEEFQRKMEEWKKENEAKLQEFHRAMEEKMQKLKETEKDN
ncbi:M56 family metallopeptidase [Algoriphagus limi]|uniref:M48 family metalloprotease n=1 Tax=Algoriphagus limi TaxID=2975273 RepID=A0ABT2G5R6_9BACT|nr:M56 family metallopeptidase [Algoriphagus limi]MCS5490605.1 M48 family metalloprotease [Algoriphagus limi]